MFIWYLMISQKIVNTSGKKITENDLLIKNSYLSFDDQGWCLQTIPYWNL